MDWADTIVTLFLAVFVMWEFYTNRDYGCRLDELEVRIENLERIVSEDAYKV